LLPRQVAVDDHPHTTVPRMAVRKFLGFERQGSRQKIEHLFDMRAQQVVTLTGGPYDGKIVEVPSDACELWAYRNMYNDVKAVVAGGLPGRPTVEIYIVAPGRDLAVHAPAASATKRP
jgi:hypothetical protein